MGWVFFFFLPFNHYMIIMLLFTLSDFKEIKMVIMKLFIESLQKGTSFKINYLFTIFFPTWICYSWRARLVCLESNEDCWWSSSFWQLILSRKDLPIGSNDLISRWSSNMIQSCFQIWWIKCKRGSKWRMLIWY